MRLPFITPNYIVETLGKKSFKDVEDQTFLIFQASKKIQHLVNLYGVNWETDGEDDGLNPKQRQAIKDATVEYTLFYESTGYDFTNGSSSVNVLSSSFSESRQYDDSPVHRTVIQILTKAGLIISQTAKYLNNQYTLNFYDGQGLYTFDAENLDIKALKRILKANSDDEQLKEHFKGNQGERGQQGEAGINGRPPTPAEIEQAVSEYLNIHQARFQGEQGLKGEKGDTPTLDFEELKRQAIAYLTDNPDVFKGDKGDQGEQGTKGDKGDQGEQGTKGDKGDQGIVKKEDVINGLKSLVRNAEENCHWAYTRIPDEDIAIDWIRSNAQWVFDGVRYNSIKNNPIVLYSYIAQLKREANEANINGFVKKLWLHFKRIGYRSSNYKGMNLRFLDWVNDGYTDRTFTSELLGGITIIKKEGNITSEEDFNIVAKAYINNFDLKDYANANAHWTCQSILVNNGEVSNGEIEAIATNKANELIEPINNEVNLKQNVLPNTNGNKLINVNNGVVSYSEPINNEVNLLQQLEYVEIELPSESSLFVEDANQISINQPTDKQKEWNGIFLGWKLSINVNLSVPKKNINFSKNIDFNKNIESYNIYHYDEGLLATWILKLEQTNWNYAIIGKLYFTDIEKPFAIRDWSYKWIKKGLRWKE